MKSSVETLEENKVKLYVEVDEDEFEQDLDQAFKVIAQQVQIKGFRKGKAPRRAIEAQYGKGVAREQALRDAIPKYLSQAVTANDVDIIATPEVEITAGADSGPLEFEAQIEVRPVIEIDGYQDLSLELESFAASDEEVAAMQQEELKQHGELSDVDRAAEAGDFLTLDLASHRDGEAVMGLNTDDWSYELGQGWVTEDFDEHLTGASVGDTLEFASVPKGTEEPADFVVTVKAIQTLTLPELTDEWVAENTGEFETIAEWTESLTNEITQDRLGEVRRTIGSKLSEAIAELVTIEPPVSLIESEQRLQLQNFARQLQQQGIDFEQWVNMTGQDEQQMLETTRPQAELAVKADLALRAIAVAENIAATDDDLEQEFAQLALMYQQEASEIRKLYEQNDAVPDLRSQIQKRKTSDWLLHNVTFVDADGNEADRDAILGHTHDDDHDDDQAGDQSHGDDDAAASEAALPEITLPDEEESDESE